MVKKKSQRAMLKSMGALMQQHQDLCDQTEDLPHILLVEAPAGGGKSTALTWLAEESSGLYIRAMASDTVVSFLSRLMMACGLPPNSTRGNSVMTMAVADHLQANDRTLIVDEADYLFSSNRLIETLRDIHDLSGTPVIIAGHTGISKRMANKPQLHSRVSTWLEFPPLDTEDLAILARKTCGVNVAEDLLQHLLRESHGNLRLARVALERIAAFAEAESLKRVTREDWGRRKFYLTHRAA